MSLVSLLQDGKPSGNKVDKVLLAYRQLSEVEAEAFRSLVANPLWSGPQIAAALREMGHVIDGDQVQSFRTKLRNGKVSLESD